MQPASFPIFDLAAFESSSPTQRSRLGAEVDRICRTTGFLAVARHGVPQVVIDAVWSEARAFFDRSLEDKQRASGPYKGYPYGYIGMGHEALAKSRDREGAPDLKESFNGGPSHVPEGLADPEALAFCYAATPWPSTPTRFKAAWQDYYGAIEGLAARIMRVFAVALGLPDDFFDRFIGAPISALRALNYPALTTAPGPDQIRAGAHSDYGSLTILLPQENSRGLETQTPDGCWSAVPPVPGAFIVNIGDLMARWTNDRWVSTVHRVVNPSAEDGGLERRQSLAFFHQPDWNAEIAVLGSCLADGEKARYAPVRSGPYLMAKFKATTT